MIRLLMLGVPLTALAASIWYALRHEAKPDSDVGKRFAHGLWIGHGRS